MSHDKWRVQICESHPKNTSGQQISVQFQIAVLWLVRTTAMAIRRSCDSADTCCRRQEKPDSQFRRWYLLANLDVTFLLPTPPITVSGGCHTLRLKLPCTDYYLCTQITTYADYQLLWNLQLQRPKRPRRHYLQPAWLCVMRLVVVFRTMYQDIVKSANCHTITPLPLYSCCY